MTGTSNHEAVTPANLGLARGDIEVPRYRYWGDQKPPENKADFFSCTVANAAAGDASNAAGAAAAGNVATMRMYGPIDPWGGYWGISARDVAEALDTLDDGVNEIRIRINSPGGSVWEAMAILNMLRAHKATVVAVVDGIAASAASYIAAGVEQTVMSPGTELMIHDASGMAYGPASVMDKVKKALDSMSNSIASIYAEAAGGTVEEWRARMLEETWYTAAEAVTAGLADRVGVVPDAGATETAGTEDLPDEVDPEFENAFDLSLYRHAGRSHAPAPIAAAAALKPPNASADGSTQPEGAAVVDLNDEQIASLREQVGFAEDADADTIVAAVTEALNERAEPTTPTTPAVPEGHVVIPAAQLADLQAGATLAQDTARQLRERERDEFLNSVRDRYLPENREAWAAEYDRNPQATRDRLSKAPVLIPLEEIGHDVQGENSAEDEGWFPSYSTTIVKEA